jgi:Lar family restriction alleviation protein
MDSKRCPFCCGTDITIHKFYDDEHQFKGYEATCDYCGARGPVEWNKEQALGAWNVRHLRND